MTLKGGNLSFIWVHLRLGELIGTSCLYFLYNYRLIESEKLQRNFICAGKYEKLKYIIVEVKKGFSETYLIHSLLQMCFFSCEFSTDCLPI